MTAAKKLADLLGKGQKNPQIKVVGDEIAATSTSVKCTAAEQAQLKVSSTMMGNGLDDMQKTFNTIQNLIKSEFFKFLENKMIIS